METVQDVKRHLLNRKVFAEELQDFCIAAMLKCGMRQADARLTADVLVTTDTWGIHTHGSKQLRPLLRLRPDRMDPTATPRVISAGPAWAIVDGNYAIATVTSCRAMEVAIEKAKSAGIGYVGVRKSNHFGAAGYYAHMAAEKDMIGLSMTNTNPLAAVPGGRGALIGTNPLAYAVPAGDEKPIMLDIATSVVAASKVITARDLGEKVPDGWIVDDEGVHTNDPSKYPAEGALWPLGGHKGYGLSLMIEFLSAILTGADTMTDLELWLEDHPGPLNQGHAFIAINAGAIVPIDQFKARVDELVRKVRNSPKAKGSDRIYVPGEMEWEHRERALAEGMELPEDVVDRLMGLAEDVQLDIVSYF